MPLTETENVIMGAGQLANEVVDEFPKTTRVGAPSGPRETDVDIALKAYRDGGAAGVIKFLDYNIDEDGNPVEDKVARQRAGGRVNTLKARGYTIEDGWVIVSRNGSVYAKYFGPGQVPAEYTRAGKAVGEAVPV
jgi:hypothetical protein